MPSVAPASPVAPALANPGFSTPAASGGNWMQPPSWQTGPVLKQTRLSPLGNPMTFYTLPNGHRIIVEQRPSDIIGLRTFVNSGSIVENAVYPSGLYRNIGLPSGLAHLDEHCRFLTTENFPVKNSWTAKVDELGGRFNASTSNEFIQHELFFNREDTASMLRLHAESVLRPVYNPQDLKQEQTNVLNEAALRTRRPMNRIYSKLSELLYDRPEIQTLGSQQDILSTTPAHLAAFRHLAYSPTNMVTVISGNVNPAAVLAILGPAFGSNPPRYFGFGNQAVQTAIRPGEVRSAQIVDPQLTNSIVHLGFPAPSQNNYLDRMSMEFLQEMLDGDPSALLPSQIVSNQRLASQLDSGYSPQKQSGDYRINMDVQPGQEQTALAGVLNLLSALPRILSQPATVEPMIASTRDRLVRRHREIQRNVGMMTEALGQEAANNTLPYFMNYEQMANLISAEDLQRAAQKYLNPATYAVVYGLPGQAQPPVAAGGLA